MSRRGSAKGAPPNPARNAHVEKGRPVTVDDIRPHRLPLHEKCRPLKGLVGFRGEGSARTAVPCACATKRFFKAHPEIIVDKDGAAWWPAEEERAG